jgi:hypothetical protein
VVATRVGSSSRWCPVMGVHRLRNSVGCAGLGQSCCLCSCCWVALLAGTARGVGNAQHVNSGAAEQEIMGRAWVGMAGTDHVPGCVRNRSRVCLAKYTHHVQYVALWQVYLAASRKYDSRHLLLSASAQQQWPQPAPEPEDQVVDLPRQGSSHLPALAGHQLQAGPTCACVCRSWCLGSEDHKHVCWFDHKDTHWSRMANELQTLPGSGVQRHIVGGGVAALVHAHSSSSLHHLFSVLRWLLLISSLPAEVPRCVREIVFCCL